MDKITYGAPRLVDWVAQIKSGSATLRVHFTGGALTAYGVTPAEYTTTNPFIQKVIESSSYFKEGRIVVLRKRELPDAKKPTPKKPKGGVVSKSVPQPMEERKEEAAERAVENVEAEALEPEAEAFTAGATQDTEAAALTKVEAMCLQDAQGYLQEHFNIASYKVRSYEAAQLAAGEHGVQFTGGRFDMLSIEEKQSGMESEVEK